MANAEPGAQGELPERSRSRRLREEPLRPTPRAAFGFFQTE